MMLLAQLGGEIGHWAALIIIIAAVIAVVFVVTQQMGVAVPAWVITRHWNGTRKSPDTMWKSTAPCSWNRQRQTTTGAPMK